MSNKEVLVNPNGITAPEKINKGRWSTFIYPLIGFVVVILTWEGLIQIFQIKTYIMPSPSKILIAFLDGYYPILAKHAWVTIGEALSGYVIGALIGFFMGIIFAQFRFIRLSFLPYVVAATTVPIIAFAPVVIIWFGPGMASKIVIVAFLTFFSVCLGTLKGIMSTDRTLKDLFYCYSATRIQSFTKLELIYALPYLFTQLRLATPGAVIGAIVAEFVAANAGLGYLTVRNWYVLDMPRLWATILVACISGIVIYSIMSAIERLATPWHESTEADQ
jgi:NitT/TauT family transport system permease protein